MSAFTIRGIDHVVLRVRDLSAALHFYCEVLGCTLDRRRDDLGLFHLRAGSAMIDLVTLDGRLGRRGGAGPATEGRNMDHLCLRIDPFDEHTLTRHLAASGLEPMAPPSVNFGAEGNGPSLYVRDPDGNVVEFKGPAGQPLQDAP